MRPSIALRANCVSPACALCTLPKTSPDSASKACRAPSARLIEHRDHERIGYRTAIEGRRDGSLIPRLRDRGKSTATRPAATTTGAAAGPAVTVERQRHAIGAMAE